VVLKERGQVGGTQRDEYPSAKPSLLQVLQTPDAQPIAEVGKWIDVESSA
jgi:hypothetical protein